MIYYKVKSYDFRLTSCDVGSPPPTSGGAVSSILEVAHVHGCVSMKAVLKPLHELLHSLLLGVRHCKEG